MKAATEMNDQQLFDNYFSACITYAENNGGLADGAEDTLCILKDGGDQKIFIATWNHPSAQPSNADLKVFTAAQVSVRGLIRTLKKRLNEQKLPNIPTAVRNIIPSPQSGWMIFNSTLNKVQFYDGTIWETVTSL